MPIQHITLDRLKEALRYDPSTGNFWWREQARGRRLGQRAGRMASGYVQIHLDKKRYQAHWLVWFYHNGTWPTDEVDHINGNKLDNRIENLRLATRCENRQNHKMMKNNTSGFRGVHWSKKEGKWIASICIAGTQKRLGAFTSPEEASECYLAAKKQEHLFQPIPREFSESGQLKSLLPSAC